MKAPAPERDVYAIDNNLFLFRKILYAGHLAGLFHLPHLHQVSHAPWQRTLHWYYCRMVHMFFILLAVSNTASTFLFSIKNFSEFLQRLLDCVFISGLYIDVLLMTLFVHEYINLLDEVQKTLAQKTLAKYARGKEQFVPVLMVIAFTALLLIVAIFDCFFVPLSVEEQELLKRIYNRKYGVRFSVNFYIPFVDLSEPWLYALTHVFIIYAGFLMLVNCNIVICELPLFMMNIEAHYDSLCSALGLIGRDHTDRFGRPIEYTDISLDQYVLLPIRVRGAWTREGVVRHLARKQRGPRYERSFLRQVVTYHWKILDLTQQHTRYFHYNCNWKVIYSLILLVTSSYQLFAPKTVYSKKSYFRFVVEFIQVIISYIIICQSSERLAKCNHMIRTAIIESHWHKSSRDTRLGLVMIILRTYRSAHLSHLGGIVQVNYLYLLKCLRFSYSLLNFFTIKQTSKAKLYRHY